MQQQQNTFAARDVTIAVVTFEAGPVARAYVAETGLPWPILVDQDRSLYHAYGMLRGSWWNVWGPATWLAYAKELLKGRLPSAAAGGSDVHQLGGDVLIDPTGTLRLVHVGAGPADRPSVAHLLAVRRRA